MDYILEPAHKTDSRYLFTKFYIIFAWNRSTSTVLMLVRDSIKTSYL